MTTRFAFGSYIPGESPVHETRAQVKIILACAFSVGIFFIDTWLGMGIVMISLALLYFLARVPIARGLRGLGPVLFILAFTVLAHSLSLTLEGFLSGVYVALRIAVLVFACMLLTFTTAPVALTDGLLRLLGPFRKLHLPVDDFAMVISLALRFIPLTAEEAYAVRRAQLARCADFEARNLLDRARAWVPVLVPLMVRLFRRSEDIAQAMEARCYSRAPRTPLQGGHMRVRDWCETTVGLAIVVALCIFL